MNIYIFITSLKSLICMITLLSLYIFFIFEIFLVRFYPLFIYEFVKCLFLIEGSFFSFEIAFLSLSYFFTGIRSFGKGL